MKKIITLALCLAAALQVFAQSSGNSSFKTRYERLVKNFGYAGVGVDNVLNQWEEADPEDCDMLEARYNYHLERSKNVQAVVKNTSKYLGNAPIAVLKDSLGNDVNYFEETFFDEQEFYYANMAIDKAISLKPYEMDYRIDKINALYTYEKETPLSCVEEIKKLISLNRSEHPKWTSGGVEVGDEFFTDLIQQYCYALFKEATPASYQAFLDISTLMFKQFPSQYDFLCNQGSYWLIAKNNPKKAQKIYEKVLAAQPENLGALRNMVILARKIGNSQMENKYRKLMAEAQIKASK